MGDIGWEANIKMSFITPQTARYVKFEDLKNNAYSMTKVEVLGTELASQPTAKVDVIKGKTPTDPGKAFLNDYSYSSLSSTNGSTVTSIYNLGGNYSINGATIYADITDQGNIGTSNPPLMPSIILSVSDNGTDWTSVTVSSKNEQTDIPYFAEYFSQWAAFRNYSAATPQTGSYVKVELGNGTVGSDINLRELRVWGDVAGATNTPTPTISVTSTPTPSPTPSPTPITTNPFPDDMAYGKPAQFYWNGGFNNTPITENGTSTTDGFYKTSANYMLTDMENVDFYAPYIEGGGQATWDNFMEFFGGIIAWQAQPWVFKPSMTTIANHNFVIDLEEVADLTSVNIWTAQDNFPMSPNVKYEIKTSYDGIVWSPTAADGTEVKGEVGAQQTISYALGANVQGRFVRFEDKLGNQYSIAKAEVKGTRLTTQPTDKNVDILKGKSATFTNDGSTETKLTDYDFETEVGNVKDLTRTYVFNLGSNHKIDAATICAASVDAAAAGASVKLSVSSTGANGTWTTIIDEVQDYTLQYGNVNSVVPQANKVNANGRYVKIEIGGAVNTRNALLRELRVWGYPVDELSLNVVTPGTYNISSTEKTVTNMPLLMKFANFRTGLTAGTATMSFLDSSGSSVVNEATMNVGTGSTIVVTDGISTINYKVLIYGDVTGDGDITLTDLANLKLHILQQTPLTDAFLVAADTTKNGRATISDLLAIKKSVLGISTIPQA